METTEQARLFSESGFHTKKEVLLHEEQLPRLTETSRGQTIRINAAGEIRPIKLHRLVTYLLHMIHQHGDFLPKHVVDFERDVGGFWQLIPDGCGWVKRVRVVLF